MFDLHPYPWYVNVKFVYWLYNDYPILQVNFLLLLTKIMELAHLEDVCPIFFYLAVNKLITNKMQSIFL